MLWRPTCHTKRTVLHLAELSGPTSELPMGNASVYREKRSVTTRMKRFPVLFSVYRPIRSRAAYSQGRFGHRGISCLRATGWGGGAFARQHPWQVLTELEPEGFSSDRAKSLGRLRVPSQVVVVVVIEHSFHGSGRTRAR